MPAIQPAVAALAGLQAEAAIQALHEQMPLAHQTWHIDIRTGHSRVVQQTTDPHCGGLHRRLEGEPPMLSTPANAPRQSTATGAKISYWCRSYHPTI